MSALLDEETTTVILEGLDFEIPCAWKVNIAEHPAAFMVTCRTCGHGGAICAAHLDWERRQVLAMNAMFPFTRCCVQCGTSGSTLDEMFSVVPL